MGVEYVYLQKISLLLLFIGLTVWLEGFIFLLGYFIT